jgi:cardiolipin synthase
MTPPPPTGSSARAAARLEAWSWYLVPRPVFTGGNEVELLRGGDALFPAMIAALRKARHEVWLATYIFHDDAAGLAMADALGDAARRGVRVRVVIDGFGSNQTGRHMRERLSASGVALAVFRPLDRWTHWLQPGQLRRLHMKLCVVDGDVGFVGGINVIEDRNDLRHGHGTQPRLDYAVRATGLCVEHMEQAVRAVWSRAWFGRDWRSEALALLRAPRRLSGLRALWQQLRIARRKPGVPVELDTTLAAVRAAFVVRDNLRQRRTIERAYINAIRGARERVLLITPYFYPGTEFRHALCQAARRGVEVHLVLQGKVDYRVAALAARVLYHELLVHGVHVHEYLPAFLHAKVGVVDDDWATVGSSNIDPLSLLLNLEANMLVRDAPFAQALAREIEGAIHASQEILDAQAPLRGVAGWLGRAAVAWGAYVYLRLAGVTGRY